MLASAQTGTEIYLFDMKNESGQIILSNGSNITKHKGYDNQPFFHPSKSLIYYSSFNDSSRSDIKFYDYNTKQTTNFTTTHDREYSPTLTPDGQFISCILQRDNGAQDLVKYPVNGGKPQVLVDHLKVGYHAWVSQNKVLLFVLDDTSHNSLHYYDVVKQEDTVIADNVGRGLAKIPGQNAMSFVQKISDKLFVIKKFDLNTGIISNIVYTVSGQDQFVWLQDRTMLMSDGKQILYYHDDPNTEFKDRQWKPVTINGEVSMLKGVTRLATDNANTKLAIVAAE
jgi:hypothetical protein